MDEIKKICMALGCCIDGDCDSCPYDGINMCRDVMMQDAQMALKAYEKTMRQEEQHVGDKAHTA